jgi:hypothetical protein
MQKAGCRRHCQQRPIEQQLPCEMVNKLIYTCCNGWRFSPSRHKVSALGERMIWR